MLRIARTQSSLPSGCSKSAQAHGLGHFESVRVNNPTGIRGEAVSSECLSLDTHCVLNGCTKLFSAHDKPIIIKQTLSFHTLGHSLCDLGADQTSVEQYGAPESMT